MSYSTGVFNNDLRNSFYESFFYCVQWKKFHPCHVFWVINDETLVKKNFCQPITKTASKTIKKTSTQTTSELLALHANKKKNDDWKTFCVTRERSKSYVWTNLLLYKGCTSWNNVIFTFIIKCTLQPLHFLSFRKNQYRINLILLRMPNLEDWW